MIKEPILFKKTNAFSKLLMDYVDGKPTLTSFYNYLPTPDSFLKQAEVKKISYKNRAVLCDAIVKQYEGFQMHSNVLANLHALQNDNVFTITTGHQLNLFTGPLYSIYKILCVINLAEEMNKQSPDKQFVPIYWIATEDHDFEEVNHFHYKDKIIRWNTNQKGAVGRFRLEGIETVLETIKNLLPNSKKKDYIVQLFEKAYIDAPYLACATRVLINELFEEYGLIIVDGDDIRLKELFIPYIKEELLEQTAFKKVSESTTQLSNMGYKVQVNPREINLFYLFEGGRERIIFENDVYKIHNTHRTFTKEALLEEVEKNPKNFSPNVLLRPLYQEVILPNVAYIGGGGELAYWLELQSFFDSQNVPFPLLKLRNSVLVLEKNTREKIIKKNLTLESIFLKSDILFEQLVRNETEIDLNFQQYLDVFGEEFLKLKKLAERTDKSFLNAVEAHQTKVEKSIKILEKRLLKAEKRKFEEDKKSIENILLKVHPNGKVQERVTNLAEMIIQTDKAFIKEVKKCLNPFEDEFLILTF